VEIETKVETPKSIKEEKSNSPIKIEPKLNTPIKIDEQKSNSPKVEETSDDWGNWE